MEQEELVRDHILATADREELMNVVDITAPKGFEVQEVTEAKDLVYDLVYDSLYVIEGSIITLADQVVEQLIESGWRPTERGEN